MRHVKSIVTRIPSICVVVLVCVYQTLPAFGQLPTSDASAAGTIQSRPIQAGSIAIGNSPYVANRYEFSVSNPPAQPQVAGGRCAPCLVAVDCADNCGVSQSWKNLHRYNFQPLAHGEFLGPVRIPSTTDYHIRVGDQLRFAYVISRQQLSQNVRLQAGDILEISSSADTDVDVPIRVGDVTLGLGIQILDDGMVYLRQIGGIHAAGLTIPQLRKNIELAYLEAGVKYPAIDVIPISTNTLLRDILDAVDARQGQGGQNFTSTVNPDGTLRLPKLGRVSALGMTLDEIKREVNLRYRHLVNGLEVEPTLEQKAAHFVFVYGRVGDPGRFEMTGPTSVTHALAMAKGALASGNRRQIVILRRAEDWRMIATLVDLQGFHYGKTGTPTDEIWLRDSDIVIVPPTPIARVNDFVDQFFTRGVYGVLPFAQVGEGFNANAFSSQ